MAPATTELYTLSLHDALPISPVLERQLWFERLHLKLVRQLVFDAAGDIDRKSTRLNSSHVSISYAVFCLKKKTIARSDIPRVRSAGSRSGERWRRAGRPKGGA